MTDTTASTTSTTKKAAEKTAAIVADNLGSVAETVEIAVDVPSKVIVNQKLIVAAGVVIGVGLGVGGVFGYRKIKEIRAARKQAKVEVPNDISGLEENSPNTKS